MAVQPRRIGDAGHDADRRLRELVEELRLARRRSGLSLRAIAAAIGISKSWLSRAERGRCRRLTTDLLARWASAVGLALRLNLYPLGTPVRDAPQLRLLTRLQNRLHASWRISLEVRIPRPGDLRAVDMVMRLAGCTIAVEAITKLADLQAQLRAALLKQRDLPADRLILLISDTSANRLALRLGADLLASDFSRSPRRALAALAAGRDPGQNAIVLL